MHTAILYKTSCQRIFCLDMKNSFKYIYNLITLSLEKVKSEVGYPNKALKKLYINDELPCATADFG